MNLFTKTVILLTNIADTTPLNVSILDISGLVSNPFYRVLLEIP